MSDADGRPSASDADSVFNRVAAGDVDTSRSQRLRQRLDESFLAPVRILLSDWRGLLGTAIILFYVLIATVGVRLISAPETDTASRLLVAFHDGWVTVERTTLFGVGVPVPEFHYVLGTDVAGQGILAQTVHATPPMLKMILAGGVFAILVGAMVGMLAGYVGGNVDQALMMVTDSLMTLPGLPLVIVISFLFEPRSPYVVGVVLAINNWSGLARTIRSQVLTLRKESYVEASRAIGTPTRRIISKDIMPNLMPYIAVNFVGASRRIIFESVALYFLGVLPTSQPNWGVMMNIAYTSGGALYSWQSAHWVVTPMVAIIGLGLGMILLAQAGDRLFNPRIRAKHEKAAEATDAAPATGEE